MHRTPLRIGLFVLAVLVTAGLGLRAYQDEQHLIAARAEEARISGVGAQAFEKLADLRASLHAYVAPGQDNAFWAKRAQGTLDALRQDLAALNAAATPLGAPLTDSLNSIDKLAAAERRARGYVGRDEALLAGDVIFTEIRDLLATITTGVDQASNAVDSLSNRRITTAREDQALLAGAALGLWVLLALLLVPSGTREAMRDPGEWRHELKATLKNKQAEPVTVETQPAVPALTPALEEEPLPVAVTAAAVEFEPGVKVSVVQQTAAICGDLSALANPAALENALSRVSEVLDATGLIVWAALNNGSALAPVAVQGFDPKLVARIGYIPRDAANVTAAAFRENTAKVSAPTDDKPGAVAVALCGPAGPAGVLSIEFKKGEAVDDARVAVASIIAAQLATLAIPAPQAAVVTEDLRRAI